MFFPANIQKSIKKCHIYPTKLFPSYDKFLEIMPILILYHLYDSSNKTKQVNRINNKIIKRAFKYILISIYDSHYDRLK
jgi:hypothetical protein